MKQELLVTIVGTPDIPSGRWVVGTHKLRPDRSKFLQLEGSMYPAELVLLHAVIIYLNRYSGDANIEVTNPIPYLLVNKEDEKAGTFRGLFTQT